jgi:peptide/nickel transport system permease protein
VSAGGTELLSGGEGTLSLEPEATVEREITARSPMQLFWRRLRQDKVAMVALTFVVLIVLTAVLAPLIVKIAGTPAPGVTNADLTDDFGQPLGPRAGHPFGVDKLGRDVFSRTVYGARVSLEVAFIATALVVLIGVSVGLIAGYYRGWVDTALTRSMDLLLAFPVLVLAIGIGVACSGAQGCAGGLIQPGLTVVIFVITLTTWPYMARIVRGQVLSLREKEFVEAAQSLGASDRRILFREVLPNLVAPIIVYSTILIPQNILYEAALSFLGVGIDPSTPSWGAMISDATTIFTQAWWFMTFPGLALLLTVLAFNLVGDGLQDALNPRNTK